MNNYTVAVRLSQFVSAILIWVAAFMVYDVKSAFLVLLVLIPLNALAALAGLVPIAGPFLYYKLSTALVFASFFQWFPEVGTSWLTTLIFWLGFAQAVFLTVLVLLGPWIRSIASDTRAS